MAAVWRDDARTLAQNAQGLFMDYRTIFLVGYITVMNVVLQLMQRSVSRCKAAEHLGPDVIQQLVYRCGQLFFSPLLLLGYVTLMFNAATGCDISEMYIYYIASLLPFFDLHEYIRCWPLSTPVLGHHIGTFGIAFSFMDLGVFPAPGRPISPFTVAFISNLGFCWAADFFHIIYRLNTNIDVIKRARKVYFYLAPFRLANIGLILSSAIRFALFQHWVGMVFPVLMGVAYAHNTYQAITFVWQFNVDKYFETHQAKWCSVQDGSDLVQRDVEVV